MAFLAVLAREEGKEVSRKDTKSAKKGNEKSDTKSLLKRATLAVLVAWREKKKERDLAKTQRAPRKNGKGEPEMDENEIGRIIVDAANRQRP